MAVFYSIVGLLGGLALFLYGMRIMGDGLKSSSGGAMKVILEKITNKPAMSFLLGIVATCMIQSSTATIVLTVGLVGAGLINFRQSVGIVLGANVGTAITAQIIRLMDINADATSFIYFFKSDNLAPIALIIGIILIMFIKKGSANTTGTICMGFGILFVGLMNMSSAVSTMSDTLSSVLVSFEGNYVLGFLSGTVVTMIIQSSSAVVGILQSIASSLGVSFCGVFAVIIGVNIGDCITTYLVCRIGSNSDQRKTCTVHIVYNVIAALLLICVIAILRLTGILNDDIWNVTMNSGGVANVHGLFRLIPAIVLLPFSNLLASIADRLVKDDVIDDEDAVVLENLRKLDPRLISNPTLALDESETLIRNMCEVSIHNYKAVTQQINEYEDSRRERISQRETLLDSIADAVSGYIVSVSPYITRDVDMRTQSFQLKALVSFERLGDLAVNLIESTEVLRNAGVNFSEKGQKELFLVMDAVTEVTDLTQEAYFSGDINLVRRIEPLEEVIDELTEAVKDRHVQRMTHGQCDVFSGVQFTDMLVNLERISDQCSDVAVYLLGRADESISGNEHAYLHELHHSDNTEYHAHLKEYEDKYMSKLDALKLLDD
ncbi:MAG: Na/Pi cotransporter family protein [Firmicutes bacterium]|nr:Na/Pi cotransporter family protein [Bacillota bacterium]